MLCAWKELLGILPPRYRQEIDLYGRESLQEIRFRLHHRPFLHMRAVTRGISGAVTQEDMTYVINMASRYSPWNTETIGQGYITAPGGHRIGICGEAVIKQGRMETIRSITSLNIRVARDLPGIADRIGNLSGSVLILGPPGAGKTTLLRDMIRICGQRENVSVVDERGELFPPHFLTSPGVDVLSGCQKYVGIEFVLRTMGPATIAVDEVTSEQDCKALVSAAWCGVRLLATAHASSIQDLMDRPIYRALSTSGIFENIVTLKRDKSYTTERRTLCHYN